MGLLNFTDGEHVTITAVKYKTKYNPIRNSFFRKQNIAKINI